MSTGVPGNELEINHNNVLILVRKIRKAQM